MHRIKRLFTGLLISGTSLLLLSLLFEVGLRGLGPDICLQGTDASLFQANRYGKTEGFRPGITGTTFGQPVKINEQGFLDYTCQMTSDTLVRGLFIGDSVTQGVGVPMDSTFAGRSACQLLPLDNPSFIGYMIEDYERVIDQLLQTDRYTEVNLFFCLNDLYYQDTKKIEVSANPLIGKLFGALKRNSYTYQWLKANMADRPQVYFRHDLALYESETDLARLKTSFALIQESCVRAGAVLKVFLLPYEYQLRDPKPAHLKPQQLMRALLTELGIDHVDVFPELQQAFPDSRNAYLYGDGIHFSEAGHRIMYTIFQSSRSPR